jgi:serine/threonine-protein kinase
MNTGEPDPSPATSNIETVTPPPAPPPTSAAGPALPAGPASRYRPLKFHARGGLGEIYLARDEECRREVALKTIQVGPAGDEANRARFLREAEITAGLQHPGIVPVYGMLIGPDGLPQYAMRFIQGETLHDAVLRFHAADQPRRDPSERILSLRNLLAHFIGVCNAVAYAHSKGVLHRDLKPQNVMIGKYGETLVVDWGLARTFTRTETEKATGEESLVSTGDRGAEVTQVGQVLGTPAYMSPEQAAGRPEALAPASDIYSLGAMLYFLLTGHPAVPGMQPRIAAGPGAGRRFRATAKG